jgi:hypothetical protein
VAISITETNDSILLDGPIYKIHWGFKLIEMKSILVNNDDGGGDDDDTEQVRWCLKSATEAVMVLAQWT